MSNPLAVGQIGARVQNYTDIFILNVGAGSCVVVAHPSGRRSMIDINNGQELRALERQVLLAEGATTRLAALEAALVNPVEWYTDRFPGDLWRFILTHPDEDHMSGLRCVLQRESFGTTVFWDLPHRKAHTGPEDFRTTEAFLDWALYELMRGDHAYEDLVWPQVLRPERFDANRYWRDDNIDILSPNHAEVGYWDEREDWNNMSFVLRIRHGDRAVVVPGDIEQAGWNALAAACPNIAADVLVASHHGRKSGFPGDGVLETIGPEAVIISSDKLPAEHDATAQYRSAVGHVFSTRLEGSIQIRMFDDGRVAIARESDGSMIHDLARRGFWTGFAQGA